MKIIAIAFGKDSGAKFAAMLSQYASFKSLYSFSTDDFFSTQINVVFSVSNEDFELMKETELATKFKNL